MSLSSDTNSERVLLIGNVKKAFSDTDALMEQDIQVSLNMLDAIDMAAKNNFTTIAVVMSEMSSRLNSALKALKDVTSNSKIILLAQMHEEPTAIQIVEAGTNGNRIADDYLICPLQTGRFYKSLMPCKPVLSAIEGTVKPTKAVDVDHKVEMKIKELEKLATTDELTGLKNRRYIWEFTRQIIKRAKDENDRVTLLMFDIDNFKHYNDVYGHAAGDEILKQTAVLIRHCCRPHDVLGRIGGDEFVVVFWDDPKSKPDDLEKERRSAIAEHPKESIFIAKRFMSELEKTEFPMLGAEGKGVLTISGGLSSFPRDGSTIQQLIGQADKALLDAKRSGKNRIYLVGAPENNIENIG